MQSHQPIIRIAKISRKSNEKAAKNNGMKKYAHLLFCSENPCHTAPRKKSEKPNPGMMVSIRISRIKVWPDNPST